MSHPVFILLSEKNRSLKEFKKINNLRSSAQQADSEEENFDRTRPQILQRENSDLMLHHAE